MEEIRERLHAVAPGGLLGGIPAENLDVEQTNARDTKLIVPLVLLVVGLILIAVLRALVAPAYLIATVLASFAATLGLCHLRLHRALRDAKGSPSTSVLMAFIFLVALGVDYNIFLMTRAREEAAVRGTREGVLAALASTGGVVTGAGLILAGTFATLTLLPLEELVQIGATVAARRPPRHLPRPRPADPGDHLPPRRARLVALAAAGCVSVAGGALHLLALGGVGAALLLQRRRRLRAMSSARRSTCARLSVSLTSARMTFTSSASGGIV